MTGSPGFSRLDACWGQGIPLGTPVEAGTPDQWCPDLMFKIHKAAL